MPDEPQVNAVSINVVVGGLMDDPMLMAVSARHADSLMVYWHLMNLTDEALTLTFPEGKLFVLELHRQDTGAEIWRNEEPPAGDDLVINVPRGELYSIPAQGDESALREEVDPYQVPRIDLKQVLLDEGIGDDIDLYIVLAPRCTSYRQQYRVDLWR
jgi:hypothetical protein